MNRLRTGEYISPALRTVRLILRLPLWLKRFQARCLRWFSRPWGRNDAWAALLEVMHPKTTLAERELVVQREAYRAAWHEAWRREGLDFVLTPPHALPAMPVAPSASDTATLVSANYAFLYNVVSAPSIRLRIHAAHCSRLRVRSSTTPRASCRWARSTGRATATRRTSARRTRSCA